LTDSGKSEVELQPELDLTRVIGAVDLPKVSVAKTSRNRVERGVVEEVEELSPELIVQPFGDLTVLVEGEIPVSRAGSPHRVSSRVTECTRRRLSKTGSVEPLRDTPRSVVRVTARRAPGILAEVRVHSGPVAVGVCDRVRRATLQGSDTRNFPASQNPTDQVILSPVERKLVNVVEDEDVAPSPVCRAEVVLDVIGVYRVGIEVGAVVKRIGEGVSGSKL